ncbi:hypothetical protein [Tropicimonas sp. IMCC34043]|uniref:hypothetical protein n=1 Tax=Tropicimonas sp. IMCC34043 TaxID=2248760 RepID=UPI0018E5A3FB|nr:hypothetical protein [Tropicimonas sp. IMCC34043]
MRSILLAALFPLTLAACAAQGPWAPDAQVEAARYRAEGPPMITLFTMVNNRSNEGAHSALMVNGSERVIFNPAGTFHHPRLPQRADVHYGIDDAAVDFFVDYHARETYRVIRQDVVVTPEQAEIALQQIEDHGAVPRALCTTSIGRILRDVPGFQDMPRSPFPKATMRAFQEIPGVRTRTYYDDSPDDRSDLGTITDSPAARADIVVVEGVGGKP